MTWPIFFFVFYNVFLKHQGAHRLAGIVGACADERWIETGGTFAYQKGLSTGTTLLLCEKHATMPSIIIRRQSGHAF